MKYNPVYCTIHAQKQEQEIAFYMVRVGSSLAMAVCNIHKNELLEKAREVQAIEYAEGAIN